MRDRKVVTYPIVVNLPLFINIERVVSSPTEDPLSEQISSYGLYELGIVGRTLVESGAFTNIARTILKRILRPERIERDSFQTSRIFSCFPSLYGSSLFSFDENESRSFLDKLLHFENQAFLNFVLLVELEFYDNRIKEKLFQKKNFGYLEVEVEEYPQDTVELFRNILREHVVSINLKGAVVFIQPFMDFPPICFLKKVSPGYESFLPYLEMSSLFYLRYAREFFLSIYTGIASSSLSVRKWEYQPAERDSEVRDFFEAVLESPVLYRGARFGKEDCLYGSSFLPFVYTIHSHIRRRTFLDSGFSDYITTLHEHFSKDFLDVTAVSKAYPSSPNVDSFVDRLSSLFFWNKFRKLPWKNLIPIFFNRDNEIYFSLYNPFITQEVSVEEAFKQCTGKKVKGAVLKNLFGLLKSLQFLDLSEDGELFTNNYLYKFYECALKAVQSPVSRNLPVVFDSFFSGFGSIYRLLNDKGQLYFHILSLLPEFFVRNVAFLTNEHFSPEHSFELYEKVVKDGLPFPEAVEILKSRKDAEVKNDSAASEKTLELQL